MVVILAIWLSRFLGLADVRWLGSQELVQAWQGFLNNIEGISRLIGAYLCIWWHSKARHRHSLA